ncbi:cardiolipin synthase [Verrucomicrobiales bacterium BCK34]|nr:cardiolipin synthase [Verrucomicrobiales bacterium BCK34]
MGTRFKIRERLGIRRLQNALRKIFGRFSRRYPKTANFLGVLNRRKKPIRALFHVCLHIVGFTFSIEALMQSRTGQGSVAWILSLNFIPILAVPAWLAFGDSHLDNYSTVRQAGLEEIRPIAEALIENRNKNLTEAADDEIPENLEILEKLASLPVMRGNKAELLVDGKNTFESINKSISEAEDYILIQYYILRADETGTELKDLLVERAKAGVKIRLLVDNYGSFGLPDSYLREMMDAGIEVEQFMDLSGEANRFQINFRNHRKIVVVDGKTGFVGGHNVGDEYVGKHPSLTPWRDSHMKLTGPVVKTLQVPFVEDWYWATRKIPDGLDWEISEEDFVGSMEALFLASGPADPMDTCALFFLTMINNAEDRIWIATPYFVPNEKLVSALQLAAIRGVDVRVIMPGLSDSRLVELTSYSYLDELGKTGVKMYRYQEGFMHQKVALVDNTISAIGSANFDNRSFHLNFEITGIVHDEDFNNEVAEMLQRDIDNSEPIEAEAYQDKPFWYRVGVRTARLFAPIQ